MYAIMAMKNGMTENVTERIKGDSIKTTTKLVYNRTTGKINKLVLKIAVGVAEKNQS